MPFFNSRAFIGASLFLAFLILLITAILLFSQQHDIVIAIMHTIVGFILILMVIWHLVKNHRPFLIYLNPFKKQFGYYNYALALAIVLVTYAVLSPILGLPPALQVYKLSQTLKAADKGGQPKELKYEIREADTENANGQLLTIELKKGPYFLWPQYAIWIETLDGQFIQPLYITGKLATNNFTNKVTKVDPEQVFDTHLIIDKNAFTDNSLIGKMEPESKDSRMRPESLPVFLHKLGMKSDNGYFVPTDSNAIIDGFSGATMTNNFIYHVKLNQQLTGKYRIRLEINHSFDYNHYYSSDRFPDDPIYSGDGYTAQPSVIYESIIDFAQPKNTLNTMTLIGRGHHSGQNGELYKDTVNLTTALQLVDRVLVSFE